MSSSHQILGTTVDTPVKVRNARCFMAGFSASAEKVAAAIAPTGLRPVTLPADWTSPQPQPAQAPRVPNAVPVHHRRLHRQRPGALQRVRRLHPGEVTAGYRGAGARRRYRRERHHPRRQVGGRGSTCRAFWSTRFPSTASSPRGWPRDLGFPRSRRLRRRPRGTQTAREGQRRRKLIADLTISRGIKAPGEAKPSPSMPSPTSTASRA